MARERLCPRVPAGPTGFCRPRKSGGWALAGCLTPAWHLQAEKRVAVWGLPVCLGHTPTPVWPSPHILSFPSASSLTPLVPRGFSPLPGGASASITFLHDWHSERSGRIERAFSPKGAQETRLWVCPFPPPSERVATLGHQRPSPGLGPPHSELQGCFRPLPALWGSAWASFPAYGPVPGLPAPPPGGTGDPAGGAQETRGKTACEVLLFQGCGPWQRVHDGTTGPRAPNRDHLSWLLHQH